MPRSNEIFLSSARQPALCVTSQVSKGRMLNAHSSGSGCSRPRGFARMKTGRSFVITFMSMPFRRQSGMPSGSPAYTSLQAAMPFVTALPPNYCAGAVITAPSKRCWGMPIYAQRRSTRMCLARALPVSSARWGELVGRDALPGLHPVRSPERLKPACCRRASIRPGSYRPAVSPCARCLRPPPRRTAVRSAR